MSKYDDRKKEIMEKINGSAQARGKRSCAVSHSDLENLTTDLMNSPDHVVSVYTKGSGNEPTIIEKNVTKRYRDSLKPIVRELGVDAKDAEALDTIKFSREHAAAALDLTMTAVADYMRAGRKYAFPAMAEDETMMQICIDEAPEKTTTSTFGGTQTVTTTKKRKVLKAKNAVPAWLKSKQ